MNKLIPLSKFSKKAEKLLSPSQTDVIVDKNGIPLGFVFGRNSFIDFLEKIGASESLQNFLLALTGDGMELAFKIQRSPEDEDAKNAMTSLARTALRDNVKVSDAQAEGFAEMCKILQLCDGGAYTNMAITRTAGKGRYRNAPSFNSSFAEPIGPGKRDIKYK